jgi:hypothetical protein
MITDNHRKEALNRAYIYGLAAKMGYIISQDDFDYGFDGAFYDVEKLKNGKYLKNTTPLHYQLKASASRKITRITKDHFSYRMDQEAYNKLVELNKNSYYGCLLIIYYLPENENDWISITENSLTLKECCYWTVIKSKNKSKKDKVITIPKNQILDEKSLFNLMEKVKGGEKL